MCILYFSKCPFPSLLLGLPCFKFMLAHCERLEIMTTLQNIRSFVSLCFCCDGDFKLPHDGSRHCHSSKCVNPTGLSSQYKHGDGLLVTKKTNSCSVYYIMKTKLASKQDNVGNLRGLDPISCRKWDVSYFTTLKKK